MGEGQCQRTLPSMLSPARKSGQYGPVVAVIQVLNGTGESSAARAWTISSARQD
jgi:hypothetical protein